MKNLRIESSDSKIDKISIHHLVGELSKELEFRISSLDIIFCSSDQIKKINRRFLNHDFSTDILTFDYSENKSEIDSEIIISSDDAKINGVKFRVPFEEEICRLVIHGLLHLNGYKDNDKKKKLKMKLVENKLLNRFKFILLKGG